MQNLSFRRIGNLDELRVKFTREGRFTFGSNPLVSCSNPLITDLILFLKLKFIAKHLLMKTVPATHEEHT
ncbi:hypothetical protein AALO_G00184360 [Alosa alosa]|uniref:Uncharacterized protein n=1 Tax=Alosa alosa TaxID=278164 RepID=A0AAV6GE85_9TELE|nr:hypothetical protein AALO_G00184360 [Alosa alosa]